MKCSASKWLITSGQINSPTSDQLIEDLLLLFLDGNQRKERILVMFRNSMYFDQPIHVKRPIARNVNK